MYMLHFHSNCCKDQIHMLPFCATWMSIPRLFHGPVIHHQTEDLLDILPAEATRLTALAEAAEVEEALKSLRLSTSP